MLSHVSFPELNWVANQSFEAAKVSEEAEIAATAIAFIVGPFAHELDVAIYSRNRRFQLGSPSSSLCHLSTHVRSKGVRLAPANISPVRNQSRVAASRTVIFP